MNESEILKELREIDGQMENILDMPDEFQTQDIWDTYYALEQRASELEDMLPSI